MTESKNAVVAGGGISGLACAWRLQQLGVPVTLLEAAEQPGGLIGAIEKDGFLFESGPQSFQGTPVLLDLISQLGLTPELCIANSKAPRFVLKHGRLRKIPMSPPAMLSSSLLSLGARMKIASEPLRRSKTPTEEESVASFVRRKFGHEILEYLVSPFVSGVYAGDPEQLSLRAAFPTLDEWDRQYGSVLRGAIKSRPARNNRQTGPPPLCSFLRGMPTLTRALAQQLGANFRPATPVESLSRSEGSGGAKFRLSIAGKQSAATQLDASALVLSTPAYTAAHLLRAAWPSLAGTLSGIAYAGVAVVTTGYDARQIGAPLDGFGVLIPRSEKYRTLGIVWNSSLFPGRAPENHFAITSFIGGATAPEIFEKTDDEIAAIAHHDAAAILGIGGPPASFSLWKHPKALPQYNLGHGHVLEAIRDAELRIPGLFFSANYAGGPSIGKCVEQGFKTAEAVRKHLESQP